MMLIYLCLLFSYLRNAATTPGQNSALQVLSLVERNLHHKKNSTHVQSITIAYAQTLDGAIAPQTRSRMSLSSVLSTQLLHSLRAKHDAVMIGSGTFKYDKPRLSARSVLPGVRLPPKAARPVLLDSKLSMLDNDSMLLDKPIVFTCVSSWDRKWGRAKRILDRVGGDLVQCASDSVGRCDIYNCIELLGKNFGVQSLLVEGGAEVIQTVLSQGLCNQMVVALHPSYLGGYRCLTKQLPGMARLDNINVASLGGDIVVYGQPHYSAISTFLPGITAGASAPGAAETVAPDLSFPRRPVKFILDRMKATAKLWAVGSICNGMMVMFNVAQLCIWLFKW